MNRLLLVFCAGVSLVPAAARAAQASDSAVPGRDVYVSQIGNANNATVTQRSTRARADIRQTGTGNTVAAEQSGATMAEVAIDQRGDRNRVSAVQSGGGSDRLALVQSGHLNTAQATQRGTGAIANIAALTQTGNGNVASLVQDGEDNQAQLAQNGDGNAMTVAQYGIGNRLAWTQTGTNLSDLGVTQTGGQALQITQSH